MGDTADPNSVGGFLTLEVELGPDDNTLSGILDDLKHETAGLAAVKETDGEVRLSQVPFKDGSVELILLSRSREDAAAAGAGFEVTIAGSTKPSLFGRQTAVFSVRLGSKAANILYESLRHTIEGEDADAEGEDSEPVAAPDVQGAVLYSLEFLAVRPAYNLRVEIDFEQTFKEFRNRIGVNALAVTADIDLVCQELINTGSIKVTEIDFTGGSVQEGRELAGISGDIMELVRSLMLPTLFHPRPIPQSDHSALPDQAAGALGGQQNTFSVTEQASEKDLDPVTAGEVIELSHTPPAVAADPGKPVTLALEVQKPDDVSLQEVTVHWRAVTGEGGGGEFAAQQMSGSGGGGQSGGGQSGSGNSGGDAADGGGSGSGEAEAGDGPGDAGGDGAQGGSDGGDTQTEPIADGATTGAVAGAGGGFGAPQDHGLPGGRDGAEDGGGDGSSNGGGGDGDAAGGRDTPGGDAAEGGDDEAVAGGGAVPDAAGGGLSAGTLTRRLPAQSAGARYEYYFTVKGTRDGEEIVQTLPAGGGADAPLTLRVVPSKDRQPPAPETESVTMSSLVGYSLKHVNITEQVKRTFDLTRSSAITQDYHPAGNLSAGLRGSEFDPDAQIKHVVLGQGPFQRFRIPITCTFDFAAHHIRQVEVTIRYGVRAGDDDQPLHTITATLTPQRTRQVVTFPADTAGTQTYDYTVTFMIDRTRTLGVAPGEIISETVENVGERAIAVDLERHLPLIPVEVVPGFLSFRDSPLEEVQVRLRSRVNGETQILKLSQDTLPQGKDATFYINYAEPVEDSEAETPDATAVSPTYDYSVEFFYRHDRVTVSEEAVTTERPVINEPDDVVYRIAPRLADRFGLVQTCLLDCTFRHADGTMDRATLELANPRLAAAGGASGGGAEASSVFAVLLKDDDSREWQATARMVLVDGSVLESAPQTFNNVTEPLINLPGLGFRVVGIDLIVPPTGGANAVLATMVRFTGPEPAGGGPAPVAQLLLREGKTKGHTVLRGAAPDAPVNVELQVFRADGPSQPANQPPPLGAGQTTTVHMLI